MASTSGLGMGGGRDGGNGADRQTGKTTAGKGTKTVKPREYMRGKQKKQWTVDEKRKIIKMIDEGARTCDIVKLLNVPESSVRNMRKKKDQIKASLKVTEKYFFGGAGGAKRAMHDSSEKNKILLITEHYLMKFLSRRLKDHASVDGPELRREAVRIYDSLCVKKRVRNPQPFNASRGWLHRFRKRCDVKLSFYHGEVASADLNAAKEFPKIAQEIIDEGGYVPEQVFNCDETGVYWKKSPKSTYAPKSLRQAAGTKMAKDRFSVLLTTNVTGECKMKPVIIYKYAKPHSYRNCDMNNLPNCVWYSNKSGYMTAGLSVKWFDDVFVPAARAHCRKMNLAFKVVLFLDNAPGHAKYMVGRHSCVQVVFLPPNTTSKLQPLDQELIANVKLLFYGMVHNRMREKTDSHQELREIAANSSDSDMEEEPEQDEAEPVLSVKLFWKQFKIKHAVDYFCDAWCKITAATVKHAWTPLLPHLHLSQEARQEQAVLARETAELVRAVPGLSNVSEAEVQDLVGENRERTVDELINEDIDEERASEEEMERQEIQPAAPTTKDYSEVLGLLGECEDKISEMVFDTRDEAKLHLKKLTDMFNEKFNEKIKARQQSLITSFVTKENDRREAARQAIVNEIDDDDDSDTPPVVENDGQASDESFDGWEEEEIEANRINRASRVHGAGTESESED